jgi:hypothetical protein
MLALLSGALGQASGQPAVEIVPQKLSHFPYEPIVLELRVTGARTPQVGEIAAVPGAKVIGVTGPFDRQGAAGGPAAPVFLIELMAERDGLLAIPPIEVRDGAESASTPPFGIAIRKPRQAAEMSLAARLETGAPYQDEANVLTITWTSRASFTRCRELDFRIPLLDDKRLEVYPLEPEVAEEQRIGLPVNGQRVIGRLLPVEQEVAGIEFRYALVPRQAGVFPESPLQIGCALLAGDKAGVSKYPSYFDNHFFAAAGDRDNYEQVHLSAEIPRMVVKALPTGGRNAFYAGVAGTIQPAAVAEPLDPVVGQAVLLTVTLDGLACPRALPALPAASLDAVATGFQLSREPIRERVLGHSRVFTYVLRPLRAGAAVIPGLPLQVFDVEAGSFRMLRSKPLALKVMPDGGRVTYRPVAARSEPLAPAAGIRHNRPPGPMSAALCTMLEILARFWWLALATPPLAWLVLRPAIRHLERCRWDASYARSSAAAGRFHRAFHADPERAWRNYLADRLGLDAAALTGQSVTTALEKAGLSPGLVAEVRRHFERRDALDYAGGDGGAAADGGKALRTLMRRIHKATAPLLVCLAMLLCLACGHAATPPDALFEKAMRMRGEKPDEARPLFTRAALGFETAGNFLNAGNCWFFAGENGRALANLRAAESRRPFDPQIREAIATITALRANAEVAGAAAPGRLADHWMKFNRWALPLRAGLALLVYLTAWTVFLTARLLGRRIHPAVWAACGIALLIPAISLLLTAFQPARGVVVQTADVRLGPGYGYDAAFDRNLPEATEFDWMESRSGWTRIRLPGNAEGWIRSTDCVRAPH